MSKLFSGLGVGLAVVIMIVSAVCNARYNMSLSKEGIDQVVQIAVALFADAGKAVCWIFFASAVARKDLLAAVASLVLFSCCLSMAVVGSLGYVATQRIQSTTSMTAQADESERLRLEIARNQKRLDSIGHTEPIGSVEKQIDGLKQDRRYAGSIQCRASKTEAQRNFCTSLREAESRLERSKEASRLEQEIARLVEQRRLIGGTVRVEKGDVQGALIAQVTGVDVGTVQLKLSLLFVVLVESGSCFLLWVTPTHWNSMPDAEVPASLPIGEDGSGQRRAIRADVAEFLSQYLVPRDGGMADIEDVTTAFVDWCRSEDLLPLHHRWIVGELRRYAASEKIELVERGVDTVLLGVGLTWPAPS